MQAEGYLRVKQVPKTKNNPHFCRALSTIHTYIYIITSRPGYTNDPTPLWESTQVHSRDSHIPLSPWCRSGVQAQVQKCWRCRARAAPRCCFVMLFGSLLMPPKQDKQYAAGAFRQPLPFRARIRLTSSKVMRKRPLRRSRHNGRARRPSLLQLHKA